MGRAIRFFEVSSSVDACQYFLFDDPEKALEYDLDGRFLTDTWIAPTMFSFQPKLPACDFWGFGQLAAFATSQTLLDGRSEIREVLLSCGELLPFKHNGEAFYVFNITACYDSLDKDATVWDTFPKWADPVVKEPHFDTQRLGGELFKIPETSLSAIYYWEREGFEDQQFRRMCQEAGLTGLTFKLLYTDHHLAQ
ncbi:MAG: hypothetical protein WKF41_13940 [Gaiellaceae bacterium]